ncbi:Phylloplanin [Morella rubra]|uniref:Phylloplanin n=1 Tax=Morella rubra TaxID=262757 RepID=A0A6A1VML1_9ROSI|nr:Phylloplanin [Morella rubra]
MALKSILLVFLVLAAAAAPIAVAQLGLLNGLLGLISIKGTVACSLGGGTAASGSALPVFPNALVQLQCGPGNVVASSTTNGSGVFSIILDPLQMLLSSLLNNCGLVVNTPLASCNAQLPALGGLRSPLQFIGSTVQGLLNIANVIPTEFRYVSATT